MNISVFIIIILYLMIRTTVKKNNNHKLYKNIIFIKHSNYKIKFV